MRIVTVLFKQRPVQEPVFLILHRCLNWSGWELLKGQLEPSEIAEEAVKREILEETSLKNIRVIKQVNQKMNFFDKVQQKESEVFGFLVEVLDEKEVSLVNNPVKEHDGFAWVNAKTVMEKLKFENTRQFFAVALKEMEEYK